MDQVTNEEARGRDPAQDDAPKPERRRQDDGKDASARSEDEDQDDDQDDEDDQDGGGGDAPKKPLFKRVWVWVVIVLTVLAVIGGVFYWWFRIHPFATTDDAFVGADIVNVAPQVSGRVSEVPVRANQRIEPGDVLLQIDPTPFRAELQMAQAQLAEAQAGVTQAEVGVRTAEAQANEAEAQYQSLTSQAANAQDTFDRDQGLRDSDPNAISEKSLIDVRDQARTAQAEAEAGRSAVTTAKTSIDAAKASLVSAKATLQAAQSQVVTAQINLGYTTISAAIGGQVVQKNVNIGSYATAGSPAMAIVPDYLYVTANYKETQLGPIRIGQPVDLHIDAYPGVDFHGEVLSIQRGAGQAFQLLPPQNATGNYVKVVQRVPVRISIEGPDLRNYPLGPGMSVVPSIRVVD